jgi:TolA-binding protein
MDGGYAGPSMREVDEEISEIKKEIIESRGLIIKTNNLTNALGADIKAIAKRQATHERRTWWNSVVAYALFGTACLFGFRFLLDVSVREMEAEKEGLVQEVKRLRAAVDAEVKRAEKRGQAEARAAQFLELIKQKHRAEVIERWNQLSKEQLSPAERAMFRDVVSRFQGELSTEAYQNGLELLRNGRFSEAAEAFSDAIRLDEGAGHVHAARCQLGVAYRQLGKLAQSKVELERVLEQNSDKEVHPEATFALAQTLDDMGDIDGARAQLRKLLSKYTRSALLPDARQYMGALNLKAQRTTSQR